MPTFGIQGLDVSGHQPSVDWQHQWNMGARFAYVKASEGNYYTNPSYSSQYQGSRNVGMIRGAYHFAIPNWSSGADQARYFVQNGGGWSADGYTMPPVLDFEFNPYEGRTINGFYFGNTCYGMSPAQLGSWVRDFGNTMRSMTGRLPVIYTNTSWWNQCLGNPSGFGDYPLWVAAYPSSPTNNAGGVPTASWSTYSIWQYSSTGPFAGDSNVWNGDYGNLVAFARSGVPDAAARAIADVRARTPQLGTQTSGVICGLRGGGCYQNFQAGAIVWSPSFGAHPSPSGPIRNAWQQAGFENGVLGYPTSAIVCGLKDGGCYQAFQGGAVVWTPATGAHLSLNGPIRTAWEKSGFEAGPMGYPVGGQVCGIAGGGCYQNFQAGAILWSPATGAYRSIIGPVRSMWQRTGFEGGPLGYPTSNTLCGLRDGGCFQTFQTGSIASSGSAGTHVIWGEMALAWRASGRESGPLGYPTADEVCGLAHGGCYQSFEKGAAIWSPSSGAQLSPTGPIRAAWQQQGYENGVLGYPTSSQTCGLVGGGCYQNFQGGAIIWSPSTGAYVSKSGAIRSEWSKGGFENGPLGYPTRNETCGLPEGGCYQNFQKGTITWSPTRGAFVVLGSIFTKWDGMQREAGRLGFPTAGQVCGLVDGGCYQSFANGAMLWSTKTNAQPSISGPIRSTWQATGFETGPLGYPVGSETCGLSESGCYQNFQNGTVTWTPARGAFAVTGPIFASWKALARESGTLGFPTSSQVCGLIAGGCYQNFQKGAILWSPATGAQVSPTGPIRTAWGSMGFERSGLGYPTSGVVCGLRDGGCYQNFQGGAFLWSPTTGAQPSVGQIRIRYASLGYENSSLGYPVTGDICTLANGGCYQNYQRGSITWYPATGTSVSSVRR
ncbi:GH25 family lysozyme [Arthrobacter pascens]|uniref:GH25 family lysozyme n=1 Tax=Arthrobacter pascens TaxID=1677 RepID=UPI0027D81408|nr:GH25 family lysozyme [Arthrobacter pascens]